jgi:squalene-associated FAD-dependent desaturase
VKKTGPEVIVVGGGVAGLAAATMLAEAGRRVLVLEARGQLGGRATAFVDRVTGELVDNGQHVLFGCYRETFGMLRRIGADANVRVQPTLEVPYLDLQGRRSLMRCPTWPSPLHLLGGVLGWNALRWTERLQVLRVGRALLDARKTVARGEGVRSDGTVADWLDRHGQTGRLREWLWEPLAVAALNQEPEEASAAPFVTVLGHMFGSDPRAASIALPVTPLHEMYALPAQRYIEGRGGEVRLNSLSRIRVQGDRVVGVEVRGERIDTQAAIAAVPWFGLASLFHGDVAPVADIVSNASAMDAKAIVTVNLWYDRRVMDETFVGLPGRQMHWVFDKRQAFGERASHLSLVASGADALVALDQDALVSLAAREVAAALPGARDAVLLRGTVIREKRATFSLAPGQPRRPGVRTPVSNLFLAGDWIDTGLPGTIESAALAGHLAARAVLGNRQSTFNNP